MKIALVHDYFTQLGGAEKVAEELYRLVPAADVFSTVALPDRLPPGLEGVSIETSWMQHLPKMRDYYRLYFLLYPFAVGSLKLDEYDLVISSSSGYVKGVSASRDALHVCYCHTPMRWVWSFDSYSARETMNPAMRSMVQGLVRVLRNWDEGASRQPDHFVANSKVVAGRIQKAYGRTAEVIHPPIDVHRFRIAEDIDDYYLVLSRMVAYKRLDLAVEACTRLNRKLLVVGAGPHREQLEAVAGPTVKFLGRLPDAEVAGLAARCRALIFPGEEDFGMTPLEVAAAGRPTIAYRAGGAIETIVQDRTGVFFEEQTVEHLMAAIEKFEKQTWSPLALRAHADGFSVQVFQQRFRSFLARVGAPLSQADLVAMPHAGAPAIAEWLPEGLRTA